MSNLLFEQFSNQIYEFQMHLIVDIPVAHNAITERDIRFWASL